MNYRCMECGMFLSRDGFGKFAPKKKIKGTQLMEGMCLRCRKELKEFRAQMRTLPLDERKKVLGSYLDLPHYVTRGLLK